MGTSWTEERTTLLEQLWLEGLSASVIADKIGDTTRNAVIGKAHREGLPQHTDARKRERPRSTGSSVPKMKRERAERRRTQRLVVNGKHREMADVVLQEPIVEIVDSEIPARQWRCLLELGQHHCRYPVGEVGKPGFFFCGAQVKEGSPYCLPHHQRCHTKERAGRWFSFAKLF